ncbi:MAG: hypothetical protein ACETWK_00725 [Candidatus Aminicenantaceae bacterium]
MKVTMVVPSYWGREKKDGWRDTDDVYDHPTSLDENGTLGRMLDSLSVLRNKDFTLMILGVATALDIHKEVESRISTIIKKAEVDVETLFFSYSQLNKIHQYLTDHGKEEFIPLLKLQGYSNIRNLCTFLPHLLESDVAVLIDDDEIFEDPLFMNKALEYIGGVHHKKRVLAVAGYYINPDNDYLINREILPWMTYWNKIDCMNRAFCKIIGGSQRLKETPFAFGGNMVLHRDIYTSIPFDPCVPRGEDMDFLISAKMFGFNFYLDNELHIKHDPPPKLHPHWRRVREDIFRFVFERTRIRAQKPAPNMVQVTPEELDPYPGEFLKDDLEDRVFRSNQMLATDYLLNGDDEGVLECMNNIYLAQAKAVPGKDPFNNFLELQVRWEKLMDYFSSGKVSKEVRSGIRLS